MLPKFPDLSSLPIEQQIIAWIALSLTAILAAIVTRWAFKNGQEQPKESDKGKIVAIAMDTGALNRATASVEALVMTMSDLNIRLKNATAISVEFTREVRELKEDISELAKQIEFLGRMK